MTLTWFEKLPNLDAYRVNGHFAPYAVLARDVRFSDAELAAEVWRSDHGYHLAAFGIFDSDEEVHLQQLLTMHRFATHPHYDQNQST